MADGGSVVLIGSVASREVLPFPAYGASKAALESLCRQAAVEGAPTVRANLLLPGLIDTPLGRLASSLSPLREQVKIPARRQGTAWEIAYGALYLLSNESSYVTGPEPGRRRRPHDRATGMTREPGTAAAHPAALGERGRPRRSWRC